MKDIVIVGTGEMAKDIRFFIERYNLFKVIGYAANNKYIKSNEYEGLPIYPLERLEEYVNPNEVYTFVAVSPFQYLNRLRKEMFEMVKLEGFYCPNLISPSAVVLTEKIGEGNWINDFAYLDFDSEIGSNNTIMNHVYISHYSKIGDNNFLVAKTSIGGNTTVGSQNFIGLASIIFSDITVGDRCIIGGGTIIKKSVPNNCVCKVPNDAVVIKEYPEDVIESKLMPTDKFNTLINK